MRWLRMAAAVAMIFAGSTAGIYFLTGGKAETDQYSSELYMEIQETEAVLQPAWFPSVMTN